MEINREIVRRGVIKLSSDMEGIIVPSRYIDEAKRILEETSDEQLRDIGSPDLLDNMLLFRELDYGKINTVIVPIGGKAIEIDRENILEIERRYLSKKKEVINKEQRNIEAIKDAVAEIWGEVSK